MSSNQTANSAKQIVWAVQESALMTPMTSPVAGVNSVYPRLTDPFTGSADPVFEWLDFGGGYAVHAEAIADHYACKIGFKTPVYPSQFAFWLSWAGVRVNTAQTLPYPTTELPGDLASLSFYNAYRPDSATYLVEQYMGAKCSSMTIECSRQSATAMMTVEAIACRVAPNAMDGGAAPTGFVFPTDAEIPTGPLTFSQTAGLLDLYPTAGSAAARTQYDALALNIKNTLDGRWWELPYLSTLEFTGREVTLDATIRLKASPDDKAAYQAVTAQTASVAWASGGNDYGFTLNGQNRASKHAFQFPKGQTFTRQLTITNLYDPTAGNDFALIHP